MVLRPDIRTECLPSLEVCIKGGRKIYYVHTVYVLKGSIRMLVQIDLLGSRLTHDSDFYTTRKEQYFPSKAEVSDPNDRQRTTVV